jgi:hypothetical protein
MRILYVAQHAPHGNSDEEAIGWALEQLGHEVVRVEERAAFAGLQQRTDVDFLLFHKWAGARVPAGCPKVFWFFDKVCEEEGDPEPSKLNNLCRVRRRWMEATLADPELLCGFCTDGDWVREGPPGKLVWLSQGFDERWAGRGKRLAHLDRDVVFFGTASTNGERRRRCLAFLREAYGDRFWTLAKEDAAPVHGQRLADICVNAKVVVAPDGPSTDRYWSNRVYLVTGLGGCLVHPFCAGLTEQYAADDLPTFKALDGLRLWVDALLADPELNREARGAAHRATMAANTYRHRCAKLVEEVERRLP